MRDEDGSNTKNFIEIGSEINPVRVTQTDTHTHRHTDGQDLAKSSIGHYLGTRRPIWMKFCMQVPEPIPKLGVKFDWILHYTFPIVLGNGFLF